MTLPYRYGLFILLLLTGTASLTQTKASFRGVSTPKEGIVWVSGTGGTVLRSVDDGRNWQVCVTPPEAEKLDFRGVQAFTKMHAVVMASGPGAASRLYETSDGCRSWHLLFANSDPAGFWDAVAFQNQTGVLLGDPSNGRFTLYRTFNGGRQWTLDQSESLLANPKGESAFAASNSSLLIRSDGKILFGTGGIGGARLFIADLRNGSKWSAVPVPLAGNSESAGIFSLAFRDAKHGIAVGGDYKYPDKQDGTAAYTSDGGLTWQVAAHPPGGYRSAVAWNRKVSAWTAVGPNGSDTSTDDGQNWQHLENVGGNAVSEPWAVGAHGLIERLPIRR